MKILLVDDDENSRIFLERALRSQGYEVDSAPNGAIALEKAQASPPEMIISDILMPEMNGFEFCHHVKTDPRLQDNSVHLLYRNLCRTSKMNDWHYRSGRLVSS